MEKTTVVQKISPNLWFDRQAEDAANFYVSIFKNSKIGRITRYSKIGFEFHGMEEGAVMTVEFQIEGQEFVGLNGGPQFNFNEAISFIVNCDSQEEVDYYWDRLCEGGDKNAQVCGWLKDKFGVSWQIVPNELTDMLQDSNTQRTDKVLSAMFQMKKLDLKTLRAAYNE